MRNRCRPNRRFKKLETQRMFIFYNLSSRQFVYDTVSSLPSSQQHHPPLSELDPALPGQGSAEEEHHTSLSIFLVLVLLGICILLVHVMLKFHFHYVPESVAFIFIGKFLILSKTTRRSLPFVFQVLWWDCF